MTNVRGHLPLTLVGFILTVCHVQQATIQPTFIRKMLYNISSIAFTTSRLTQTTGSMNEACYLQCFVTPQCMSFIYNSETTECYTFSGLLDDPPYSTNSLTNGYFIQGSIICSEMGYVFEAAIPFCYNIHHDTVDYDTSVYNCQNEGGRLIQIDSLAKQKITQTFVIQGAVKKYRIAGELVNRTWIFPCGHKIPNMYWSKGNPTLRGDRSFLALYNKTNKWDDVNRSNLFGYICERLL